MDLHAEPLHSETLRAAPVGALRGLVDLATERHPDEPLLAEFLPLYFAEVHDAVIVDLAGVDIISSRLLHANNLHGCVPRR